MIRKAKKKDKNFQSFKGHTRVSSHPIVLEQQHCNLKSIKNNKEGNSNLKKGLKD